jgi:ribosomal protein S18 acetylase RimI-like enzyme
MNVRSFQLSDYADTTSLFQEVMCEDCYEETMKAFGRQLKWDSELVLVAEENGQVIGAVIGTIDKNKAYYYKIAVHPDFQRQGIGKALVQAMEQRFVRRKVARIMVASCGHNEALVAPLFQSAGYEAADFFRQQEQLSIVNGL